MSDPKAPTPEERAKTWAAIYTRHTDTPTIFQLELTEDFRAAADAARAEEREECAKVCDKRALPKTAAAIRARGSG